MLQDKEQDPLPSHRHGSASKTEVENYLDCLLVHHQHDNDQGNDSVEPAIVVKDLVDVPALSYDKDCSAAYRQRQKVEVLSFAADMACHLLYFGHQNPKLLRPTLEFRNFCVQVVAQFKTISPAVVLLALKYLARMVESLKNKNQRPKSEPGADSLMFTGALVLACNYLEEYHSNLTRPRIWARCTGFHKAEIESCRKMLMELLDYRLVITPAKYADWMAYLVDHTMKHMPKHQFVPLEHQSLAELAPINELYSTSDVGYIPPLLKTFTGDLICLTPSPPMQEAGSCKGFECDAAAVSSSHPQGQAQGQPRGEAETGLSAGHAGDFAAHMACCILYGHRGSVAAATTKDDIVEPRPSLRGFCRYIIDVAGLPHTVVLLALKYMQKLVWSLNSYHMYPEDDQKTEVQIFTGAVMAAQKYASEHDQILTNGAWACILGVPIRLVNFIERMLLEGIDYNLFTSADEDRYALPAFSPPLPSPTSLTTVSPMLLSGPTLASELASPAPKSVATGTNHTHPDGRSREPVRNAGRSSHLPEDAASSTGGAGAEVTAGATVGAAAGLIIPPSSESAPSSAPYPQQPHSLNRPSQATRANRPAYLDSSLTAEDLASSLSNFYSFLQTSAPTCRRPATRRMAFVF